jgi:hypothetical protein
LRRSSASSRVPPRPPARRRRRLEGVDLVGPKVRPLVPEEDRAPCINWLRQEPYVRAWSQAYRDDGLIVIGVHMPEFSFEQEIDRVRQATEDRAIDYPVALDSDYAIWSAFDNH